MINPRVFTTASVVMCSNTRNNNYTRFTIGHVFDLIYSIEIFAGGHGLMLLMLLNSVIKKYTKNKKKQQQQQQLGMFEEPLFVYLFAKISNRRSKQ